MLQDSRWKNRMEGDYDFDHHCKKDNGNGVAIKKWARMRRVYDLFSVSITFCVFAMQWSVWWAKRECNDYAGWGVSEPGQLNVKKKGSVSAF